MERGETLRPAVEPELVSARIPAEARLLAEQTELVLRLTPFNVVIAAAVSLVTWFALAPFTPAALLNAWFVLVNLNHAFRLALIARYRRVAPAPTEVGPWIAVYLGSALFAGVLWGVLGTVLFPPAGNPYQGVVVMILAGMVSGAVFSLSPLFVCFVVFALPAVIPPAVFFLMSEAPELRVFGIGVTLYLLAAVAGGRRISEHYRESMRLRIALEESVKDRERAQAEAERARQAAEAASQAKSRFLATMSHEIRTPLNGILGVTELMLDSELDTRQQRYMHSLHYSTESLLGIVSDVLDFARIEAGKIKQEVIDFDLRETVAEITDLLAQRAHAKGLAFRREIDPAVPVLLRGDAGKLRQVVTNLVGNAVKFTDRGGIVVRIGCGAYPQDRPVQSSDTEGAAATLWFAVEDSGIGIDPADHAHVFQAFGQVDQGAGRLSAGTGLGLAISRELVEMMGGRIGVLSERGLGSTFWFSARFEPVAPEDRVAAAPPPAVAEPLQLDGHVLVVEDNAINREVACAILRRQGLCVSVAENGLQALEKLAAGRFDAVLMDCQMPVMDGFEATRRIRDHERNDAASASRRVPIIAVTANAIAGDRERCLEAGMDDYIAKPFRKAELQVVLAKWVATAPVSDR